MWDDAFVAIDGARCVVAFNDAARDLFGALSVGQNATSLFAIVPEATGAAVVLRGPASERLPVDVVVGPITIGGASARAIVVRGQEAARRDAIRQMAANVGHGLRNPLGAISNAWYYLSSRMKAGPVSAEDARVATFLAIVDVELKRCSSVVSDLFDYANVKPLNRVPVHMKKLVDQVVAAMPAHPGVSVENHVPELPLMSADAEQLRQALAALVQNAVEAAASRPSPSSGARVTIDAVLDAGDVVVSVDDNGAGIPADVLPRLFAPLYTTKLKGTGLGLAIVDAVARRHGGSASASASPSGGASFRVRLPLDGTTTAKGGS